ncbi:tRNA (adenosine(37)-N6)-threonylcarbamoyltransferase complex dimerization subunit type 1 TsaB [Flavobacterium sp.]|uniref:tRNA (adenosine(37)-N6)-threonylcarbamoyltransferase complex dimerization subunit type 1 TsaB n=1 Tax=Flavobacterium sp. TaxID=239 RepID=UPI0026325402|nr:tRNA (adenosine(37)-N6)-threonylcarbamoyltransferase complex dimerization subunit type 1 TsaB [Flavobacterium sp.]
MSYILNIETATKNCSVALAQDGVVISYKEIADLGYSHAEKLHVFIDDVLKENDVRYNDLSAIAVSQGPGSYTGLRIGVSAAKGLCYALNIPLIAVDTLETLSLQAKSLALSGNAVVIPMVDARRMEVYSAIFDAEFKKIRDTQAEIVTPESFQDIDSLIYIVGDCAEKCRPVLTAERFTFVEGIVYPSAKEMCAISFDKHKKNDTVDVAYFEPFYLKEFFLTSKPTV